MRKLNHSFVASEGEVRRAPKVNEPGGDKGVERGEKWKDSVVVDRRRRNLLREESRSAGLSFNYVRTSEV